MSDSSPASSSSSGNKTPASKPGPVSVGESPGKPKSGAPAGGTSPSKPKSQVPAPPKSPELPNLPKLPKPTSGSEPPKGFLPGHTPGLLPIGDGNRGQDHGKASSVDDCVNPVGFKRLSCQKVDAIMVTLVVIMCILMTPFLIWWLIRYCRQRRARRKNRHEEEGMELTTGAMDWDPIPGIDNSIQITNSNIGLAISTSEETVPLATEQTQGISSSCSAENPSEVHQPRAENLSPVRKTSNGHPPRSSLNRGRSRFRAVSMESVASGLSSGMIRTAMLGEAWQDPTVIDVQASPVDMRNNSKRRSSSSDANISNNGNDGRRDGTDEGSRGCVVSDMEKGDFKEAESRGPSSRCPDDQSNNEIGGLDH